MSAEGEDVKPKVDPEGAADGNIQIVVKDQEGGSLQFKVKPTTKFEKIFKAYCQRKSLEPASVRFLFDGLRLKETQTPAEMNLENEDVIEAVMAMVGGGDC